MSMTLVEVLTGKIDVYRREHGGKNPTAIVLSRFDLGRLTALACKMGTAPRRKAHIMDVETEERLSRHYTFVGVPVICDENVVR